MKNKCDSWEEAKLSMLMGILEELIPTLKNDSEGFKTSMEDVTTDAMGTARELELEREPEDGLPW